MKNNNGEAKVESYLRTDDKVDLLLTMTLEYKVIKMQENAIWRLSSSV